MLAKNENLVGLIFVWLLLINMNIKWVRKYIVRASGRDLIHFKGFLFLLLGSGIISYNNLPTQFSVCIYRFILELSIPLCDLKNKIREAIQNHLAN